jgi:hypothetical protein
LTTQCSLTIRGFNIRGILAERIYRELLGRPVHIFNKFNGILFHYIQQRECQILSQTLDSYIKTCGKIGGPEAPKFVECAQDSDPCIEIKEAYCIFKGQLVRKKC